MQSALLEDVRPTAFGNGESFTSFLQTGGTVHYCMFFVWARFRTSFCVRVMGCTWFCFARALGAVGITLRLGL